MLISLVSATVAAAMPPSRAGAQNSVALSLPVRG
jgi:hypothetical protein